MPWSQVLQTVTSTKNVISDLGRILKFIMDVNFGRTLVNSHLRCHHPPPLPPPSVPSLPPLPSTYDWTLYMLGKHSDTELHSQHPILNQNFMWAGIMSALSTTDSSMLRTYKALSTCWMNEWMMLKQGPSHRNSEHEATAFKLLFHDNLLELTFLKMIFQCI